MATTTDAATCSGMSEAELDAWIDWLKDERVLKALLLLLVIGAGTVVDGALRLLFSIVRLLYRLVLAPPLKALGLAGRRGAAPPAQAPVAAPDPPAAPVNPPVVNLAAEIAEEAKGLEEEEKDQEEQEAGGAVAVVPAAVVPKEAKGEFDVTTAILLVLARHVENRFRDGDGHLLGALLEIEEGLDWNGFTKAYKATLAKRRGVDMVQKEASPAFRVYQALKNKEGPLWEDMGRFMKEARKTLKLPAGGH